MDAYVEDFLAVFKSLHEFKVEYVLVGDLAVALHGVSRMTEHIDIFVHPESSNIERLKLELNFVFDDKAIDDISLQDLKQYAVVRYGTPREFYIDIIDHIGQAFTFDDLEYEIMENNGVFIRIATIGTLIKLKSGTMRDIDKADVILLKEKSKG